MEAPSFSTFSAVSEIFVTIAVLYVVLTNFRGKGFPKKIALAVIIFEFGVNMAYMMSRMGDHADVSTMSKGMIAFAAIHGSLSLLVFIGFVVYAFIAYADFKKGRFFFKDHPKQTYVFIFFWMLSVLSGELLYLINYVI
ncbi:MAG: hypothetical protein KDD56_06210 [Bdellovibrionales bacterium]|nr:hypothetical protein [Bdellovibrionales bacterium]